MLHSKIKERYNNRQKTESIVYYFLHKLHCYWGYFLIINGDSNHNMQTFIFSNIVYPYLHRSSDLRYMNRSSKELREFYKVY